MMQSAMQNLVQTIILAIGPGAVDGIMALGVVATFRVCGVVNFALAATGTLGIFIALSVSAGQPLWFAILIGCVAGAAVGLATYSVISGMRTRHLAVTATIATFAVSILIGQVIGTYWTERAFPSAFPATLLTVGRWQVPPSYVAALVCGLVLLAAMQLMMQRIGATRPAILISATWAAAGVLAVLAGLFQSQIAFDPTFLQPVFLVALVAALIGGLRSLPVAFAAGLFLEIARALFQTYIVYISPSLAPYTQTFLVILMLLILLAAPTRWTLRRPETRA